MTGSAKLVWHIIPSICPSQYSRSHISFPLASDLVWRVRSEQTKNFLANRSLPSTFFFLPGKLIRWIIVVMIRLQLEFQLLEIIFCITNVAEKMARYDLDCRAGQLLLLFRLFFDQLVWQLPNFLMLLTQHQFDRIHLCPVLGFRRWNGLNVVIISEFFDRLPTNAAERPF